jgi:hypothetical protein
MGKVSVTATIDCSAETLWNVIRNFGSIKDWVSGPASLTLTGQGVGAERHIVQTDGRTVQERLEALDDENKTLRYAIVATTLPLVEYESSMSVRSLTPNKCEVHWFCTFRPRGAEEQVTSMLETAYRTNLEKLAAVCHRMS